MTIQPLNASKTQHEITKVINLSIVCLFYLSVILSVCRSFDQSTTVLFLCSIYHSIYRSVFPVCLFSSYICWCMCRSPSPSSLVGESLTIFSFSLGKKVSDMRLMCSWGNDTLNRICHFKPLQTHVISPICPLRDQCGMRFQKPMKKIERKALFPPEEQ